MIDTIYIEEAAAEFAKTDQILARFPRARKITVRRYGEIFNPKAQNFRLQKNNPALILAVKHDGFVLPAPAHYGIGGEHNYYFSHMMNCVYDCRYCFLQGMYQSANYVVFVNFEDFFSAIGEQQGLLGESRQNGWFFSGYDCDSLALEPVTQFIHDALDEFAKLPDARLELRTKSTQIRPLLKREAMANCVVAFSLSPAEIVAALEHKTASLEKRVQAAKTLGERGWPIGLRFDPIIGTENFQAVYRRFFDFVFSELPESFIHSVSLGPFRLPKPFYKKMLQLYPEEPMFAADMQAHDNLVSYETQAEQQMLAFCRERILQSIPDGKFFPCVEIAP
ncbi:MAG: DNA photolyase [Gammaproteobacteria bacterium]|nr:DNA photolyase [Gammaproteobacteria bacterium]